MRVWAYIEIHHSSSLFLIPTADFLTPILPIFMIVRQSYLDCWVVRLAWVGLLMRTSNQQSDWEWVGTCFFTKPGQVSCQRPLLFAYVDRFRLVRRHSFSNIPSEPPSWKGIVCGPQDSFNSSNHYQLLLPFIVRREANEHCDRIN